MNASEKRKTDKKEWKLLEEITPDIIITDMKMAKMDGVEFLKKLHEKHSDIPVIVISGYKAFDYMSQAIEHGVVGYVLKPFSTEEIEKQLLKAVSRIEQKNNITKMREKNIGPGTEPGRYGVYKGDHRALE